MRRSICLPIVAAGLSSFSFAQVTVNGTMDRTT